MWRRLPDAQGNFLVCEMLTSTTVKRRSERYDFLRFIWLDIPGLPGFYDRMFAEQNLFMLCLVVKFSVKAISDDLLRNWIFRIFMGFARLRAAIGVCSGGATVAFWIFAD